MDSFYELLSHTADTGIRVRGAGLEELFANAARAFYDVLTEWGTVREGDRAHEVELEGADREDLLVHWLSELLYLFDAERVLFASFDFQELTGTRLRARMAGEGWDPDRHPHRTDIKAVTYHGLEIRERESGLEAQVIFDL